MWKREKGKEEREREGKGNRKDYATPDSTPRTTHPLPSSSVKSIQFKSCILHHHHHHDPLTTAPSFSLFSLSPTRQQNTTSKTACPPPLSLKCPGFSSFPPNPRFFPKPKSIHVAEIPYFAHRLPHIKTHPTRRAPTTPPGARARVCAFISSGFRACTTLLDSFALPPLSPKNH